MLGYNKLKQLKITAWNFKLVIRFISVEVCFFVFSKIREAAPQFSKVCLRYHVSVAVVFLLSTEISEKSLFT